jgi:hypothetical protein
MSTPITEAMRQVTLQAIRRKGVNQSDIAQVTGNGDSWVTKFLSGALKTIKQKDMEAIEGLLGINYYKVETMTGSRSVAASKLAARIDTDPAFAKVCFAVEEALDANKGAFTPRYIPTQDMTKIGQEIIKISFANEDKPGKVARMVLELLA